MLVLALDTTTPAGSVALNEVMRPLDPQRPVATQLPMALIALLDDQGRTPEDIDVFAVATGPGSFTGIRIGIATMQGLAFARGKPLIGVSAFEAFATLAEAERVATWIDAWRGEVYAALYDEGRVATEPMVASPAAVMACIPDGNTVFIGDGAVKYRELLAPHHVIEPTPLLAATIARLARERAARGEAPPPHAIRPLYVRRPDAELAREPQRRKGSGGRGGSSAV